MTGSDPHSDIRLECEEAVAAWANVMDTHSDIRLEWGPTNVDRFLGDPKRIGFFMSRYTFAAKMLSQCFTILDIGCGDGMGTLTFASDTAAARIMGLDWEQRCIDHAVDVMLHAFREARPQEVERLSFVCRDFWDAPLGSCWEGIACLDVIEHIEPSRGDTFISRIASGLQAYGVAVIGTPNVTAAQYASSHSKAGHINLYSGDALRDVMRRHFSRVFMFGMNDGIVHTGFLPMAHYLIAVGVK